MSQPPKSTASILYEQARCIQELQRETIQYYERRLKIYFRSIIGLSILSSAGFFVSSIILSIHANEEITFAIPAIYGGLMSFYRVKQNEYGLVERSAMIIRLQNIIMEIDMHNGNIPATRLDVLLSEYKHTASGSHIQFPRSVEQALVAKWTRENISIPDFIQSNISSKHHQLYSLNNKVIDSIRLEMENQV
jgi:hypothetical protein